MNALSPTLSSTTALLAQAAGYHSADDAQRMQALVHALLHGRRAIALSCADADTLGHYSRLLVRDLRQQDNVKIIPHLPGSTDKLVQQVNELLADASVEAVFDRRSAPQRPVHVFVVHDSPELSDAEFTLLVRLVSDLPGANLRIALIQDRDIQITGHLQALGPQALHWNILAPGAKATAAGDRSREALKGALQDALAESPEGLPAWARGDTGTQRRRWRLAFWRRGADERGQGAARAAGTARTPPAAAGKAAPKSALTTAAKAAPKTTPKTTPKTGAKPAAKSVTSVRAKPAGQATARSETRQGRGNRIVLVAGLFLSAALAGGLGMFLQMHQPPARAAARPAPATPATPNATQRAMPAAPQAATLAAIATR